MNWAERRTCATIAAWSVPVAAVGAGLVFAGLTVLCVAADVCCLAYAYRCNRGN